jgi:hypothetical protein
VGGREEIGSSTATRTREGRGEERGEREREKEEWTESVPPERSGVWVCEAQRAVASVRNVQSQEQQACSRRCTLLNNTRTQPGLHREHPRSLIRSLISYLEAAKVLHVRLVGKSERDVMVSSSRKDVAHSREDSSLPCEGTHTERSRCVPLGTKKRTEERQAGP